MKNILLSLIAIFITLGFSGCAPQFLNGVSPQGKDYNSAINRDSGNLKIMTTVEEDIKKRLPILVKAAALEFKKQGYEYFTLNPNLMYGIYPVNSGMNMYITNAKDMLDYCFPNAYGLETKCDKLEKSRLSFFIFSPANKSLETPTWSVKEVIEDNFYNIETEELVFKELNSTEMLKANK